MKISIILSIILLSLSISSTAQILKPKTVYIDNIEHKAFTIPQSRVLATELQIRQALRVEVDNNNLQIANLLEQISSKDSTNVNDQKIIKNLNIVIQNLQEQNKDTMQEYTKLSKQVKRQSFFQKVFIGVATIVGIIALTK